MHVNPVDPAPALGFRYRGKIDLVFHAAVPKCRVGGVKLSLPPVYKHEIRKVPVIIPRPKSPPVDDLVHRPEIILARGGRDPVPSVPVPLRPRVSEPHERGDRLAPLDVRYVEALYDIGNPLCPGRLSYTSKKCALLGLFLGFSQKTLPCVFHRETHKLALRPPPGSLDVNPLSPFFGKPLRVPLAVPYGKRQKNSLWNVVIGEIKPAEKFPHAFRLIAVGAFYGKIELVDHRAAP